ncbi:HNH endonuclease [Ornithinimicrobium avium]|uniref:HNH endonuclease n=1 Tax=Ornithinimicrobium avium TaxID=2283195 RepID=UPI0038990023
MWPHKGHHTNAVWNGLLLRADLHALFDLFQLTVEADSLKVRVSPALQGTEYEALEGTVLTVPATLDDQPAREALAKHNEDCAGWLWA